MSKRANVPTGRPHAAEQEWHATQRDASEGAQRAHVASETTVVAHGRSLMIVRRCGASGGGGAAAAGVPPHAAPQAAAAVAVIVGAVHRHSAAAVVAHDCARIAEWFKLFFRKKQR